MFPLCFFENLYWMVQMMLIFMSFIFMIMNYYHYYCSISYMFGYDLISYSLMLLSLWIVFLMFMASEKLYLNKNYLSIFMLVLLILLLMLMLTFSSINLLLFFIFFESSLIPMLFLILGWGYQPERLQSGLYLLFYTIFVSFPMLIGILYIYKNLGSLNLFLLSMMNLNSELLYFSLLLAFLVKLPMFMFHLWLPKAHVEAPISGSMVLAGVLLKLGGYGMIRVGFFLQFLFIKYSYIWVSISLIGGILISLVCLLQVDMKTLIAYSSVVHMGMFLCGFMTMSYMGICGSYILMIGHGLCSSGMFCLANIMYERLLSRSLLINKGLINFMPSMTLWWFLLSIGNMAAPPSLNLLGEILIINSLIHWSYYSMYLIFFVSFFSASYSLYLYSYSQHGKMFSGIYSFSMGEIREYLLLLLHWFPLNFLILKSDLFLLYLNSLWFEYESMWV
nr:NADH dehydrogenase subunit 4 [Raymondia sp. A GC-2023a]